MGKWVQVSKGISLYLQEFEDPGASLIIHIEGHGAQLISVPEN